MIKSEIKLLIVILAVIGLSMVFKSVDSYLNISSFVNAQTSNSGNIILLSAK